MAVLLAACPGMKAAPTHTGPGAGDSETAATDAEAASAATGTRSDEARREDAGRAGDPDAGGAAPRLKRARGRISSGPAASSKASASPAPGSGEPADDARSTDALDSRSEDERRALAGLHVARGERNLAAGDPDRAIAEARKALSVDADDPSAIALLAASYLRKQWHDRAESVLDAATGREPGARSAQLWMLLGLAVEPGDPARAEDAYRRATELKPNYAKAWINLGAVRIQRARYADAISALETALSLAPGSASAHTNLGTAYRRRGLTGNADRDSLLRKAEQQYLLVIQQDATYAPAHLNLGLLYLDANPFPGLDAVTRLQRAVQHLTEFKKLAAGASGARGVTPQAVQAGDEYLDEAQRALQAETGSLQRKNKLKRRKR